MEEPRCLIHAPDESVDPSEIERIALAEAIFLVRGEAPMNDRSFQPVARIAGISSALIGIAMAAVSGI